MKKQATEEQKAKAAARRDKIRKLVKALGAMPEADRRAMIDKVGSIVTVEGRHLSPVNMMLVATQIPNASVVGGFRQWLRAGRVVKKGEHGAGIWVPCGAGRGAAGDGSDAGLVETATAESDGPRFILGTVFDISQTCDKAAAVVEEINDNSQLTLAIGCGHE